jgi:hypothetical protein
LSFYEGVGVEVLKIEESESELLCTDSTALEEYVSAYKCRPISVSLKSVLCDVTPCNPMKRYELAEEPFACNFRRWRENALPICEL